MPHVMTVDAEMKCPKQGRVTPTGTHKLTVRQKPVLLAPHATTWSVAGCTPTATGENACKNVASLSGASAKLTVASQPVLLSTAAGLGTGASGAHAITTTSAGQSILTAV